MRFERSLLNALVLGLLSLGLVSCAPPPVAPMTPLPVAKTVVIVPSVPEEFHVATQGFTAFGNRYDTIDDSDWRLNDVVTQSAQKLLSPLYQVMVETPDRDLSMPTATGLLAAANGSDLASRLKAHIHQNQNVDLYFVIDSESVANPADAQSLTNPLSPSTVVYLEDGVGVDEVLHPLQPTEPELHGFLLLTVVDGKTFKVVYQTPLRKFPGIEPVLVLPGFPWHSHWAEMSDVQHQELENATKHLLADSVVYTISQIPVLR